ncbi:hypothetical protein [Streptomyces naphthomycinicus]|uniref:hypothetical protein n=1 Tax=Streptomyces naphthomycinicus TaxID=2872625 RepID=UPI001CEDF145|nr:hypothetical protein [Streptomyces sp. TML10]
MTRTPPSAVQLALAAEVRRCGLTATPYQLERWRRQLWLAPTEQWTDTQAGGIRPEIVHRAAWLAALSRAGRSISWAGWTCWALDDTPQTAQRLREAVSQTLQRPLKRAGVALSRIPQGDGDDAFEARQKMAARLLTGRRAIGRDLDGILRAHAAAAGLALPPPRSVSNVFHTRLTEVGARLLIGGMDDVSPEELTEAWESVWTGPREQIERIGAAHITAEQTGIDLRALSPLAHGLRGLLRAVEEAGDRKLCAAVRTCTKASGALMMLLGRADDDAKILARLMDDNVMWDQWARIGGIAPDGRLGEAAIALSTAQYLLVPGWAEDLTRYQALMDTLLATPAAPDDDGLER